MIIAAVDAWFSYLAVSILTKKNAHHNSTNNASRSSRRNHNPVLPPPKCHHRFRYHSLDLERVTKKKENRCYFNKIYSKRQLQCFYIASYRALSLMFSNIMRASSSALWKVRGLILGFVLPLNLSYSSTHEE